MLAHQRRKRQEVCNKVGETPQNLGPPTTYTSNHTTHLQEGGLNGQNNAQRGRQGGAYSDQNTHGRDEGRGGPSSGFAPPQQLHGGQIGGGQADGYFQSEPQGAGGRLQVGDNNIHIGGPVPAPVFSDARSNYLSPTT
ncbi:Hypothetical protein, putative [Bodo saltans]|uniref:Uncharacterized protein n=1 Tax=Bodo saltans TaxID=75058 RepID=A0A0S4KMK8_BODSA|nr:Hypothetical protein, putative [Bodo saltans]|eukprot:CUI14872.1 Hypothetical protein, putative [Bodo saltans]